MKKKAIVAVGAALTVALASVGAVTVSAEVNLEACDLCFQTTVNALLDEDEVGSSRITADRKPLYDMNLEQLGCVYEFEILSGSGFAIIICDDGEYVAREFASSATSPYAEAEGLCVYVNTALYLESKDGAYYEIGEDVALSEEAVEELKENAVYYFTDLAVPTYEQVKVYYTSFTKDSNALCYIYPQYSNPGGLVGACAAIAGANLIGYYDRFYEDLIPNHAAGFFVSTLYKYNVQDTYVSDAVREIYSDMNGTGTGITESNFKSGMQKYCAKKNLSCDFTSILTSGKLTIEAVKASIEEGKPIAILLSTYTICSIYNGADNDLLVYEVYTGNHVMAGFAYRDITYTMTNGSTARYRFVGVSTGFGDPSTAYYNIDYCTNVNAAYKVYIH